MIERQQQIEAFGEWLKDRPEIIKQMAEKLKPWLNYRLKPTGQHCALYSYSENCTVTIQVYGHDDEFIDRLYKFHPFCVFGVDPNDLEHLEH